MKTQDITLCGKQVTLSYCYATEISFKILSDEDITDFFAEAAEKIQSGQMPDTRKTIYLILAAMTAYYESTGTKAPVTDKDIMFSATPNELGTALGTIIKLRSDFYHVPANEPQDKNQGDEKNE